MKRYKGTFPFSWKADKPDYCLGSSLGEFAAAKAEAFFSPAPAYLIEKLVQEQLRSCLGRIICH